MIIVRSTRSSASPRDGQQAWQPLWLLGWIAAVGGFAFQALALHRGQLSVVQPILITELVFVLVLRRVWIHQDVARTAWVAAGVVCVALGVFLAMAEPTGGHPNADTGRNLQPKTRESRAGTV